MRYILIRHGLTKGNLEKRYIGCRTDEELCREGRETLEKMLVPPVCRVFASPLRRCIETARILYPGIAPEPVPDFRECDFGLFENHNYTELNGRQDYQAWIDSGGEMPFPGCESRAQFAARCVKAFHALRETKPAGDCALIVHGGTIMAIMEAYARPGGGYYDFQVQNGQGFILEEDGSYIRLSSVTGQAQT